ncbi:MerC domain-containing protein [Novosphingobium album (ex Liu et al. 2023)]|uniref:MerC domain-containing protein n=1 Tax=Novosphingobium album (ex Liu et al. 2023) TaxID=3031130 RepID=A0ABT5WNY0_9SPHN|nr:MerC domain-containing protein [Novosphingobium album (ex Liu et al. 2023)]MDE8651738.1 MerC domain-containing protein [Novosphingobium album (ex Liu et al. 2023)]
MRHALLSIRDRLDRMGVVLSALCAVHCVLGIVFVSVLGLGGRFLLDPRIHQIGLALAVLVGLVSLGFGVLRHGRLGPLAIGAIGLGLMASAILSGHGLAETVLTVAGVALVATAHIRNLHRAA